MRRKAKPPEHKNNERWLVSYADFITLLFAFFTTMYAISTVDAQKMGKMVLSMRASFDSTVFEAGSKTLTLSKGDKGKSDGSLAPEVVSTQDASTRPAALPKLNSDFFQVAGARPVLEPLKRRIEVVVGPEVLNRRVHTRLDRRGLTVSLGEGGFFDSGSDQIKPEGRAILDTIAAELASVGNHVRVEGHTDNVPIRNSRFPSNWELSTSRATAIVAYLVVRFGLPPGSLSAAGYAEYRPVAGNDTEAGRARNRRVDLVILDPSHAAAEP